MKSYIELGGRQSGRTTRMINHAVKLAINGEKVVILFHKSHMAHEYQAILSNYEKDGIIPFDSIKCKSIHSVGFDWDVLMLRGDSKSKVLFDHAAIESNVIFRNMYHEATRFNAPPLDTFVGDNDHGDALPSSKSLMKRIVELETQLEDAKKLNEQITETYRILSSQIVCFDSFTYPETTELLTKEYLIDKIRRWKSWVIEIRNLQIKNK